MEAVDGSWARRALPGFFSPLEVVASVPTTMARAAELAAAGAPEGATVVAEEQTEGRGRLGRAWVAPPGSSLLVSVVLRPPAAADAVWLTVAAAGVALAGAVDEVAPGAAPAGLKWPNDLELGGRKAAGLLAEARLEGTKLEGTKLEGTKLEGAKLEGARLAAVLLGMGVNVGQGAGDFPAEMAGRATSVSLAAGAPVDRGELLAAWAGRFLDGYAELCAGRPGPVLAAYRERLVTVGRQVRAERIGAGPVVGTAVDLTPAGALVVQTASGARVEVLAGDVHHLRPA
jgi:BirA family transcriptional regulator, biotin operon repressor / biotin---[acetyl-CoA-carboxylase] ligase